MENQQQQSAATTALCRAGCGFFGSSSTDGLCSKCFKDSIKKKQDTGRVSPPSSITSHGSYDLKAQLEAAVANAQANVVKDAVASSLSSSSSSASLAIETAALSDTGSPAEASTSLSDSATPKSKTTNRCAICRKRVGLTGFLCRCSGLYCAEHRYETEHNCDFDYKTLEREAIKKNNPLVITEKIQKI